MKDILISFVVLSYNQKEHIKNKLIPSIYKAMENLTFEILIMDDGSSDIDPFSYSEYDKVKLFINEHSKNQSRLRNNGIKNSKGKWVYFIDGDDDFIDLKLEKEKINFYYLINILKENKNINTLFLNSRQLYNGEFNTLKNTYDNPLFGSDIAIYKKNFLIKNNIFFEETKYYFDTEDLYFYCSLLSKINICKECIYFNYYLTYRNIIKGSNTYSKLKRKDYPKYMSQMINDIYKNIAGCKNELYICNILNVTLKREIHRWFEFNNKGDV